MHQRPGVGVKIMDKVKLGGILKSTDLALLGVMGVPHKPGVAGVLLEALGDNDINVELIAQSLDVESQGNITLCVARQNLNVALSILRQLRPKLRAQKIIHEPDVAIVSIFGPDFRQRPGIAGPMFTALARADINILAISTSISTISCVIEASRLADAIDALSATFELP